MPKPISLKKHIIPGVVVGNGTNGNLYKVIQLKDKTFKAVGYGVTIEVPYNASNMTVYQRVADNELPFN